MDGDYRNEARLWPLFAAISTRPRAWLVPRLARDGIRSQALRRSARFEHHLLLDLPGERPMFEFRDLFQWDRFITPTIIKTFYWLVIALIVLFGISGIFNGLAAMAISPFGGFIVLLGSIASMLVGIIFSRIAAEFILIVFRINEHLGAIRDQGQAH
jgi:hypothetical protein